MRDIGDEPEASFVTMHRYSNEEEKMSASERSSGQLCPMDDSDRIQVIDCNQLNKT